MATLNTSIEGSAISRAYRSIIDSPGPSSVAAAKSPTYSQWAVFAVHAPLASAFQQDTGKESVLKVYRTGEGELEDMVEEFSEGKIQFGFAKVQDPNTTLQKCVLIAWCGQGVPERTKGYFTSHLTTVSKILHGYHVQVTARTVDDLSPDGIINKVADASGSKYSGGRQATESTSRAPPVASKPVFTPSRIGGSNSSFNPLGSRSRGAPGGPVDEDGWEQDAAPVTRTQLERVQPAYTPTKVNMDELTSQKQEPSRFTPVTRNGSAEHQDVVKGGYQPVGKVDIAALRRQSGPQKDDRPAPVKGSYEPVGKVDIAAIRARAQPSQGTRSPPASSMSPAQTGTSATSSGADGEPKLLADRSSAFAPSERLSSMPKPKVGNKFGGSSSFTGTKAPTPGAFDAAPSAPLAAPIGTASKTFADEGGKTPAQIWAEKKARQRGDSGAAEASKPTVPLSTQTSGTGAWESGYSGKKWGVVQTTRTGPSSGGVSQQRTGDSQTQEEPSSAPGGGVGALRDRFKGASLMGANAPGDHEHEESGSPPPPPMDMSTKPTSDRGVPMPGLPARSGHPQEEQVNVPPPPAIPRTPSPEADEPQMRPSSPIRIAQPVARTEEKPMERPEEPPLMPVRSLNKAIPDARELDDMPAQEDDDTARAAGRSAAETEFGPHAVDKAAADVGAKESGKRALIQYDYEKAEDNEIELREGEYVTNIEMVDEDWWMGQDSQGESGLFPSNYVELVEDEPELTQPSQSKVPASHAPAVLGPPSPEPAKGGGKVAIAQYDYEAAEDNELSFPDGAKITNVEFPDEDWWLGEYNGKQGLFPANYVELS